MTTCPACGKHATTGIGSEITDMKKHISKCAEHEKRWLREGKDKPTPHLEYLNSLNNSPMAKQQPQTEEIRVKETLGFTLNGITVYASIDYNTRQVSLVEKDGSKKQWLFAQRTPDYFAGWRRILEAMHYAIVQAEARLESQPSLMEKVLIAEAERGLK